MSNDLQSDEKLCPFCAEVIKKAAIKCRYCHSELPPTDPSSTREKPQPVSEPESRSTEAAPSGPASGRWTTPRAASPHQLPPLPDPVPDVQMAAVDEDADRAGLNKKVVSWLLVACLAAIALFGAAWWRANQTQKATGVITSVVARDAAMEAAATNMETILTYSYSSLDQDAADARKVMTRSMIKQYDQTLAESRDKVLAEKRRLQAKVLASSIISATEHKAVALVFLDQLTTVADQPNKATFDQRRVRVTMERKNGAWLVSRTEAL
ncbi:MAG TPA: hypothetical protein PKM12_01295 [Marmoricola sp.]|nr:hypothetical protein [Marmoricola sp.]